MDVQPIRTQPPSRWEWTQQRETAAALLALGELSVEQIADAVGCDRNTLWWWRKSPEFAARVKEHLATVRAAVMQEGIAQKANRIRALEDRWRRIQSVIEERAAFYANHEDEEVRTAPGVRSGLLVRRVRVVGNGRSAREVVEYEADTALLREMRSIEEQAAREVGDWSEKPEREFTPKLYVDVRMDLI